MVTWSKEIAGQVDLDDKRLNERLLKLMEDFAAKPEGSIPECSGGAAATQAAYRFFSNDAAQPEKITAGIAEATAKRCQGEEVVLAVQDTTSLDYTTHTDTTGLGPLENTNRRGLFLHTVLAVSTKGVPLGVIAQQEWARDPETTGKRHQRKELPIEAKESSKWLVGMKETEERLDSVGVQAIMVGDQEADVYDLFALGFVLHSDWLVRARHDRKVDGETTKLVATVQNAPVCAQVTVELERTDKREARTAHLEVRATEVVLLPPKRNQGVLDKWWGEHPEIERIAPEKLEPLRVGVVLAKEVDVPAGVKPVRWLLVTSLRLDSVEAVLRCVEYYRLRWLVERYHFVLKSGCKVERLQLETVERLERALAVYAGVAWRLLWLTYEARVNGEQPCTVVLEEDAWRLLHALAIPSSIVPLNPPSLSTAVRMIAKLGGFLGRKGDGDPGVKTLWRGLRYLRNTLEAYRTLIQHPELLPANQLDV